MHGPMRPASSRAGTRTLTRSTTSGGVSEGVRNTRRLYAVCAVASSAPVAPAAAVHSAIARVVTRTETQSRPTQIDHA